MIKCQSATGGAEPESADPDLIDRAAQTIGLKPDATAAQVRRAALRRLPDEQFLPSLSWHQAWQVLRGQVPPLCIPAEEENRLRAEVEVFAAGFFAFSSTDRERRWWELAERCAGLAPLRVRLRALRAGLEVEAAVGEADFRLSWLARYACDLFVRKPADRAIQRQLLLRSMHDEIGRWQLAARQLRRRYPAIAALAPDLVQEIGEWTRRQRRLTRVRQRNRPRRASGRQTSRATASSSLWVIVLIAIVLTAVTLTFNRGPSLPLIAPERPPRVDWPTTPSDANAPLQRLIPDPAPERATPR
jgi:hypothetical protein